MIGFNNCAIVRNSGCGKSIIIGLILRWYDPIRGGIFLDEHRLLNISIKDNICYGRPNATKSEIIEASKIADINDFINSLPEEYDTIIGNNATIVRAIIRRPKLLLLDEVTSSLDSESVVLVQMALDKITQGRTTITVAHRLSTIKDYDIIIETMSNYLKKKLFYYIFIIIHLLRR
ncbi:P-loop containing nucleoside triphosphate hydrolase protein [Neocallimastix lanati (nom. inval.)]|nr:P-loop containing nucleoside triphosphate hydrolase protein [Neocallimastix sp. JGI-2020a]